MVVPASRRPATYADVLAAPPYMVAEIVDGELHLSPRPGGAHASVATILVEELGPPFRRGRGGPGGWLILVEPELHLGAEVVVPDLAGWRRAHAPSVMTAYFEVAPDFVCEVLSPSTEKFDRAQKLAIYAREQVGHAWLVNPLTRTVEVLRRTEAGWLTVAIHHDDQRVRAEPFDAIELDLAVLWAEMPPVGEPTPP